jgi:hypothetical protein
MNVSLLRGPSPPQDESGDGRKIDGGPIYSKETICLIADANKLQFWSHGAISDQRKWEFTVERVCFLIKEALRYGKYLGSEWCLAKPGGPWAACDSYVITVKEWNDSAHKELSITYYFKIAISRTGQLLLSASNHPEGT